MRSSDHCISAISCGIGGERISRHNHLRDALFQAAVQAGLGPVREPPGFLPGSDYCPADVLIPFWTPLAVDRTPLGAGTRMP